MREVRGSRDGVGDVCSRCGGTSRPLHAFGDMVVSVLVCTTHLQASIGGFTAKKGLTRPSLLRDPAWALDPTFSRTSLCVREKLGFKTQNGSLWRVFQPHFFRFAASLLPG